MLGETALDVRIGGVYVLASILDQSPEYRSAVVEILTSYVRLRSPWPSVEPTDPTGASFPRSSDPSDELDNPSLRLRARKSDVEAVLDVLTAAPIGINRTVNLNATDLRRAHLEHAHLSGFTLQGANLEGAWLLGADLGGAWLLGATLEWSNLKRTILTGAHVDGETKCSMPETYRWRSTCLLLEAASARLRTVHEVKTCYHDSAAAAAEACSSDSDRNR